MGFGPMLAHLVDHDLHLGALFFGVVLPLTILGLVIYGVWELVRARDATAPVASPGGADAAPSAALAVLDERLARGEIDPKDYVERRDLLAHPTGPPPERIEPADQSPEPTELADQPAGSTPTTELPTQQP
jgi:hypothetical protein